MSLSCDVVIAALLARMRRASGAPLAALAGAMLVHYACDFLALFATASAASLALHDGVAVTLRPFVLALAFGALGVLGLARLGLSRLGRGDFATALRAYRARDLAGLVALRACLTRASRCSSEHAAVPRLRAARRRAGAHAAGQSAAALPIAPGGLGTAQAAMLALFAGFGPPERWLAYALLYSATLIGVRVPLGFAVWSVDAAAKRRALEEAI
jgi:hypothetical protein